MVPSDRPQMVLGGSDLVGSASFALRAEAQARQKIDALPLNSLSGFGSRQSAQMRRFVVSRRFSTVPVLSFPFLISF
jgi:hypothetical protein